MKNAIVIAVLFSVSLAHSAGIIVYSTQPNQTLSPTTTVVNAGVYAMTNLSQVDTDLAAANIVATSTIFGVAGTIYSPLPRTGQTNSYALRDDGALKSGVVWPVPRFAVQANTNCVKDNLTGLIWARNANLYGAQIWSNALASCTNLYGGQTDWRLPNVLELRSLLDNRYQSPALTSGHPFFNVQNDYYNVSTTEAGSSLYIQGVNVDNGDIQYRVKSTAYFVWPVRGP